MYATTGLICEYEIYGRLPMLPNEKIIFILVALRYLCFKNVCCWRTSFSLGSSSRLPPGFIVNPVIAFSLLSSEDSLFISPYNKRGDCWRLLLTLLQLNIRQRVLLVSSLDLRLLLFCVCWSSSSWLSSSFVGKFNYQLFTAKKVKAPYVTRVVGDEMPNECSW